MWVLLAFLSALSLGFYDIAKKTSLRDNNVLAVLFLNTVFCTALMSPALIGGICDGNYGFDNNPAGHFHIIIKAAIVLSSWFLGYFSIKHLPLTIAGPVNASRPVMVLVGALLVFGERLTVLQWAGVLLGFFSLYFISRIGRKEGFDRRNGRWLWLAVGASFMGAVSALYDKYLMGLYNPVEVQAWYTFYQMLMMGTAILIVSRIAKSGDRFKWRWSIILISVFLTLADLLYFYALHMPGAMIAVVSMLRRGSVIVSFAYGVLFLKEKNVRQKAIDLALLLLGLVLLALGSLS